VRARLRARAAAAALALAAPWAVAGGLLDFTPAERVAIAAHGPWPPAPVPDPSNRVERLPAAQALGQALFFDSRLSADGIVSCATCHDPAQAFQDGRRTARGLAEGVRNTSGLLDAAGQRWYGWDGAADSLWAASLRPIVAPAEMGGSAAATAALLRHDERLRALHEAAFGPPAADDDAVLVAVAKALAAWQATLVSPRTAFDEFRDALERGDAAVAARYPLAAQRGLRLFVGEGRCNVCHAGPRFTNGEFADIGVPFFVTGGVDPGRHGGVRALRASRHNRLGPFSDEADPARPHAMTTRQVLLQHRNFGEFKVPGLRQLAHTAPYFHAGSAATLAEVIRHYSELDEERLHADGERLLRPLKLTPPQAADLEAFLRSLSAPAGAPAAR
jgi:cytochrome c peroxidase